MAEQRGRPHHLRIVKVASRRPGTVPAGALHGSVSSCRFRLGGASTAGPPGQRSAKSTSCHSLALLPGGDPGRVLRTALGANVAALPERYTSVQHALVEAVRSTHAPWTQVPDQTLDAIQGELLEYDFVYSDSPSTTRRQPRSSLAKDLRPISFSRFTDQTILPLRIPHWYSTRVLCASSGIH
jgi:hypothetical protein